MMVPHHGREPWTWREDWAAGRITGTTGSVAKALWLFVLVWNGFTWPVAWLFLKERAQEPGIYFVLLFPAVGVLLLFVAIRGVVQQRKYGASTLLLRTIPGVIGRTLEGDVDTRIETAPQGGFEVRLLCVRRSTTGHGKNRRTHSQTLWQDHVTVPPADLGRGPGGVRIPVAFALPPSAVPTHDSDPEDAIDWRLVVNATMAGVDYSDLFEVPVFATGAPPLTDAEREALMAGRRAHAAAFVPEATVMRIVHSSTGGTVFAFKPAVKVSSAAGALTMTVLSWAGTYYLLRAGIPIAPLAVGFIALLFTAGTLVALFHSSSVTVTDADVVIRHRILGFGRTRRIPRAQITDVRSEVVGEGNAQSWEVKVQTIGGKSYSAGAMIPTQVEADWSAEQLRTATGTSNEGQNVELETAEAAGHLKVDL
jgi:hypothetical protein